MSIRPFILHPSSFILFFCCVTAWGQTQYDPGDWVSYRNFRDARALDASTHDVFIATSGGVLQYQLLRQKWSEPMTVGYSLSEAIPLDDPLLLLFDEQTNYLWVATRTQLLQYDVNAERWTRIHRNLWGPGDRVVNLGVGGSELYLETIPAALYDRLFLPGSPLPLADWQGFRHALQRLADVRLAHARSERWRRSRRCPLARLALQAPSRATRSLRQPRDAAREFPRHAAARWLELARRRHAARSRACAVIPSPIGWSTASAICGRVSGVRVCCAAICARAAWNSMASAPPATTSALFPSPKIFWMGGLESGDNRGITHVSADLNAWQFYEPRDNSRIRSTETFDIARFGGSVWFATQDGLLEFPEKDRRWKLYTVGEILQSNQLRALAAADSELWIGNTSGLCVLTRADRKIARVPIPQTGLTEVLDLMLLGQTLYVSTTFGFYQMDVRTRSFTPAPLDPAMLNAPVIDMAAVGSEVWAATGEGIQRINTASSELKAWPATDWMASAVPTCIAVTNRFVWVGTRESGFYRFNRESGEWLSYTTADGLIDNRVEVLRPDGDDLLDWHRRRPHPLLLEPSQPPPLANVTFDPRR